MMYQSQMCKKNKKKTMVQQWYNNGRLLIKSEILQYDYGNGIIFSIHAIKKGLGLGKG